MGSNEIILAQRITHRTKLAPRHFCQCNLLFAPASQLTDDCRGLLGDNPFFSFSYPASGILDGGNLDDYSEILPERKDIDSHLAIQILTCPGFDADTVSRTGPGFWSQILDENGRMNMTVAEIAQLAGLTEARAASLLESLKHYVEPAGLFASSLRECYLLQLDRLEMTDSVAWKMVSLGFDALSSGNGEAWAKNAGIDSAEYNEAMRALRRLDPFPGRNFNITSHVVPEIEFVMHDGHVTPKLLCGNMPRIESFLSDYAQDIHELLSANWAAPAWSAAKSVFKRLGLRYKSLLKIALCISSVQGGFISGTCRTPSPLTYKTAAHAAGLETSTAYRTVSGTWCVVKNRVVPMKSFFSRSATSNGRLSMSELKMTITELNAAGLNDRMIAERLHIPVRTVAWHRRKIGLGPAGRSAKSLQQ